MRIPIKFMFPVWMMMLIPGISRAQEKQLIDTVTFRVSGVCDECKMRIENAALIKGVKWVQWDKETQMLTAIYRNDKANPDALQHAVAKAGHDTEKEKAPEKVYHNLPRCCAYRNGVEKH